MISQPPGIDCSPTCAGDFVHGTEVTLIAGAEAKSAFAGWEGACLDARLEPCVLMSDQALDVTARFETLCHTSFELGPWGWHTAAGPTSQNPMPGWQLDTSDHHSPMHAWVVSGRAEANDHHLGMDVATQVPIANASYLRFWHRMGSEPGADGGVLEFSTDGGATWFDLVDGDGDLVPANSARMLRGGYNAMLSVCCDNPLIGREAWSGELGWQEVVIDLSDFAGHSLELRWRFGSNDTVASTGWWLDDVELLGTACPRALRLIFSEDFEDGSL